MHSPDNSYDSNLPKPDDEKFNTDGLELVPLNGEKGGLEGGAPTEEVYTAEMQADDATRFSVAEKPVAEVADAIEGKSLSISNPYNLATEGYSVDADGLGEHIDTLSTEQRKALSNLLPEYASDLNRFGGSLEYADRKSDFEVMEIAVDALKTNMREFSGGRVEMDALKQRYHSMKKAFPDFSLGEDIRVELSDGTSSSTFK